MNLMIRRHDSATSLRDYTMQVRDLYNSQIDVAQNRTITKEKTNVFLVQKK